MSNHNNKLDVAGLMQLRVENPNKYSQALEQLKKEAKSDKNMLDLYIATATAEIGALQTEKKEARESVEPSLSFGLFEKDGKKYPTVHFNNFSMRPFSMGLAKIRALIWAIENGYSLKDIETRLVEEGKKIGK